MATVVSVSVYLLHHTQIATIAIPISIVGILGSALAIFIAFRNNTAYSRWWEARTVWGNIINKQ